MWSYLDENLQSLPQEDVEEFEQQTYDTVFIMLRARRNNRYSYSTDN